MYRRGEGFHDLAADSGCQEGLQQDRSGHVGWPPQLHRGTPAGKQTLTRRLQTGSEKAADRKQALGLPATPLGLWFCLTVKDGPGCPGLVG